MRSVVEKSTAHVQKEVARARAETNIKHMTNMVVAKVSNGQTRIQAGDFVAVMAPDSIRWELYDVDADGLEVFRCYATDRFAGQLDAIRLMSEGRISVAA